MSQKFSLDNFEQSDHIYSIEELRNVISEQVQEYAVDRVLLVGSYMRREAAADHDVDLVVVVTPGHPVTCYDALLYPLTRRLQKRVDIFEVGEFKNVDDLKRAVVLFDRSVDAYNDDAYRVSKYQERTNHFGRG